MTTTDLTTDAEAQAARRSLLLFHAALIVLLLAAGLLVYAERRHDERTSDATAAGAAADGAAVADLGPVKGTPVNDYIARRAAVLEHAAGDRVAVVSFTRYATATEARKAVGDAKVLRLMAAAPAGDPEAVRGDLDDWVGPRRKAAADQRAEIQRLLDSRSVDDPDYLNFYRSEVARLTRLESSLDPKGALVFGVVVKAPASGLRALARAPGIRLVDVGTSGDEAGGVEYRGLRPEETATAGNPPTRP